MSRKVDELLSKKPSCSDAFHMEVFTYFDLLKKNAMQQKWIKKIQKSKKKNHFFFQELEQEKYHLRRRLQAAEEEYELRVNDLQADINSLRKSLEEATTSQRQSEKEKSLLITNLTEQNQRLTSQLKEVRTIYLSVRFLAFLWTLANLKMFQLSFVKQ